MIVQTLGTLAALDAGPGSSGRLGSIRMYNKHSYAYATLYRQQPNVRTCVDFLARNIAQLGLHVFRRVSDTDRQRLTDHPLARLLAQPLPPIMKMTRYRLIESLMGDMGIYFNAYWLKLAAEEGGPAALMRVPPSMVTVSGGLVPSKYTIHLGAKRTVIAPEDIVHFRGYNPQNPVSGLSPLETLRRILAEEFSMGDYREDFWGNAARMSGIIKRPKAAGDWSEAARGRFKKEFEALYSGSGNGGRTAILEEDMDWEQLSFNAQESEYLGGRKLTREECARAYHIPLPMVGILEHATFSNIKEQHRNLYQDSLGPWLMMLKQDIELQLLSDFADSDGVYVEFNIEEKMKGSFDEQSSALQSSVGRPWMSPDEARARMNLPSMGGTAAQLGTPLNILVSGDTAPPAELDDAKALLPRGLKAAGIDPTQPGLRKQHEEQWARVMARTFERQRDAITGKVAETEIPADTIQVILTELWDSERWNRELHDDLFKLNTATASVWGAYVASELEIELDDSLMSAWLEEHSRIQAEGINGTTGLQIGEALADEEPRNAVRHLFEIAIGVRAAQIATTAVTAAANFGATEGAKQSGLKTKTWHVNSGNPRPSHAAVDGETVAIGDLFSLGMLWPGDPAGGVDEVAGCTCSVTFGR